MSSEQINSNKKITFNDSNLFDIKDDTKNDIINHNNNDSKSSDNSNDSNDFNHVMKTPSFGIFGSPKISAKLRRVFIPGHFADKKLYKYDWNDVHNDLENGKFIGSYGWDNACYLAIAETKANTDLSQFYSKRTQVS